MSAVAYARSGLVGGSEPVVPVEGASTFRIDGSNRPLVLDDVIAGRRNFAGAKTHIDRRFPHAFSGFIELGTPEGEIEFLHVYGETRLAHVVWPQVVVAAPMTFGALERVATAHLREDALLPRFHGFVAFVKNHRDELWAVTATCHWSRFAVMQECLLSALPANDGLYRSPDCLLKFTPRK